MPDAVRPAEKPTGGRAGRVGHAGMGSSGGSGAFGVGLAVAAVVLAAAWACSAGADQAWPLLGVVGVATATSGVLRPGAGVVGPVPLD